MYPQNITSKMFYKYFKILFQDVLSQFFKLTKKIHLSNIIGD